MAALERMRRPLCRCCLDWSERRPHLGGSLGKAVLDLALARGWVRRPRTGRALAVTPPGEQVFRTWLRDMPAARSPAETIGYRERLISQQFGPGCRRSSAEPMSSPVWMDEGAARERWRAWNGRGG